MIMMMPDGSKPARSAVAPVISHAALRPAFAQNNVAIFLASDDRYAPYLAVGLASIAAQATPGYNYDLLVLDDGLSGLSREKLGQPLAGRANISLRFVDLAGFLRHLDPSTLLTGPHLSRTAYGRLFAPSLFSAYSRLVYLDCDLVILSDPAELYGADLGGQPLGGVRDCGINIEARRPAAYAAYCQSALGLTNLADYINSGVLVMDLKAMRALDMEKAFRELLGRLHRPWHADQDIINTVGQGHIKHLDPAWNVFEWLAGEPEAFAGWEFLTEPARLALQKAARSPKIIHYTGPGRPWLVTGAYSKVDHHFWRYARLTPYYESLLLHSVPDYETLGYALNHWRNLSRYWRYKILSAFTWGRAKRKYQEKAASFKGRLASRKRLPR